jgi:2-polyprenyl-3-methyl-5-hydroxy-6-metoxy-1,4-benzoquinol methylase
MAEELDAHRRLVEKYFETTSSHGGANDNEFSSSNSGLARRLGNWCDVAGMDVVDLGSGMGELCKLAIDFGARSVIGVNLSALEIDFARRHSSAEFVCQDVVSYLIERPPESIDLVFALNILEHLDKNALVSLLDAARQSLRPGGEPFGWMKTIGVMRKTRHRGGELVEWFFVLTAAAYNLVLVRIPKILAATGLKLSGASKMQQSTPQNCAHGIHHGTSTRSLLSCTPRK